MKPNRIVWAGLAIAGATIGLITGTIKGITYRRNLIARRNQLVDELDHSHKLYLVSKDYDNLSRSLDLDQIDKHTARSIITRLKVALKVFHPTTRREQELVHTLYQLIEDTAREHELAA